MFSLQGANTFKTPRIEISFFLYKIFIIFFFMTTDMIEVIIEDILIAMRIILLVISHENKHENEQLSEIKLLLLIVHCLSSSTRTTDL